MSEGESGTEFSRMRQRSRPWPGNWRTLLLRMAERLVSRLVSMVTTVWSVTGRPGQAWLLRESELCFWMGWLSEEQELC